MPWVEIVTLLVLVQYIFFSCVVGIARTRYGVAAPSVTGHEGFERRYRVQMNTLELLVALLPGLWLAARHVSPTVVAGIGAVYLLGRMVYLRAYTRDPATRTLGFLLSVVPVVVLLGIAGVGALVAAVG